MVVNDFVGFIPDDLLEHYVGATLRRVFEQAPYESSLSARLEQLKENGGFRASFTVETIYGPFHAEGVAHNARHALELAEKRLTRLLDHWRSTRWEDEAQAA
jgi:hypothetical protein